MRRILSLAWLDVTQILRSRGQLVSVVILPVLLTFVFGMAFGAKSATTVKVAFADGDGTARSREVGRLLAASPGLSVETTSEAAARKLVADHKAVAAVVVAPEFGRAFAGASAQALKPAPHAPVTIATDPESQQQAMAVREVVDGIATRLSADALAAEHAYATVGEVRQDFLAKPLVIPGNDPRNELLPAGKAVRDYDAHAEAQMASYFPYLKQLPALESLYATADARWEPVPPVNVVAEAVTPSKVRGDSITAEGNTQYSMGFVVMFVMMTAMTAAGGILEEREFGTLRRLLTTPLTRGGLLGGKVLGVWLSAALQAAILIGLGVLAFRVPWGDDPVALLAVLGAYLLAATGIGVLASSLVRTRSQLAAISSIAAVALSMLGGCYWPIDIVSPAMQHVAMVTPTGWAMRGLTDVVVRHQGLEAASLPCAVLLGIAALTIGLGVWKTRFE